jgi:hypothetical protein
MSKRDTDRIDRIGKMGQSHVTLMCQAEGITCNPSIEDNKGWDVYIEFPNKPLEGKPFDAGRQTIEAKIQVKSTDSKDRSYSFKLSTLRDLIFSPLPVFVCYIEFDKKNEPQVVFLKHFNFDFIAEVLKKLRSSKSDKPLNAQTMKVKFEDSEMLSKTNMSQSFASRIISEIGDDIGGYNKMKNEVLVNAGFEFEGNFVNIVTRSDHELEELIDVSLGLNEHLEVEQVTIGESRFGVDDEGALRTLKKVRLSFPGLSPAYSGTLTFRKAELGFLHEFECAFYISPFNPYVDVRFKKVKVTSSFFIATLKSTGNEIELNFNFEVLANKAYKSLELLRIFQFLDLINTYVEPMKLVIEASIFQGPILLSFKLPEPIKSNDLYDLTVFKKVYDVCRYFNIEERLSFSPLEVIDRPQLIEKMHELISSPYTEMSINLTEAKDDFYGRDVFVLIPFLIPLGEYYLGLVTSSIGKTILKDECLTVEFSSQERDSFVCKKIDFDEQVGKSITIWRKLILEYRSKGYLVFGKADDILKLRKLAELAA